MRTKNNTLAFSIFPYLLVTSLAVLYVYFFKVGLHGLFSFTDEIHPSLSDSEYTIVLLVLLIGIGSLICLIGLLGVAVNRQVLDNALTVFDFIHRK